MPMNGTVAPTHGNMTHTPSMTGAATGPTSLYTGAASAGAVARQGGLVGAMVGIAVLSAFF